MKLKSICRLLAALMVAGLAISASVVPGSDKIEDPMDRKDLEEQILKRPMKNEYIVDLEMVAVKDAIRYIAIWNEVESPDQFAISLGLSSEELGQQIKERSQNGYRPLRITSASLGDKALYSVLWKKDDSDDWTIEFGLVKDEFEDLIEQKTKDGFAMTDLTGCAVKDKSIYSAIFEKKNETETKTMIGMFGSDIDVNTIKLKEEGYRVRLLSCHESGQIVLYSAVWEKGKARVERTKRAMTHDDFMDTADEMRRIDMKEFDFCAAGFLGEARYSGAWWK